MIGTRTISLSGLSQLAIFVLAGWVSGWTGTATQQLTRERKDAYAELTSKLHDSIKFCKQHKLYAERKRISGIVLRFAAEDEKALLGAGYRKKRAGVWNPPSATKKFRDAEAPTELKEVRSSVRGAIEAFVEFMEGLVTSEGLSDEQLELLSKDIVAFDPRNGVLRGLRSDRGEIYFGGRWILEETMSAIDGRAFLREIVEDALEEAAYEGQVTTSELMGLSFHTARARGAQVLVTSDAIEAKRIAELLDATGKAFEWFFGQRVNFPPRCRFFVMQPGDEKSTFLDNHPNVGPDRKAVYNNRELSGIEGSSDQAFFAKSPDQGADAVVRMCWLWYFQSNYGISMDKGWVADGFGVYLTEAFLGSRLTWFNTPSSAGGVQWGDLIDPKSSWMEEAAELFGRGETIEITQTLNKSLDQLTTRDLLIAYAFVGYLSEVRREILGPTLRRIGLDDPVDATFQKIGELNLSELPVKLKRWLDERRRMPDVVFAQRSSTSLRAILAQLGGRQRAALSSAFATRLEALDTDQAQLLRRYKVAQVVAPFPEQLEFYDPLVQAPADPIPRRRLAADDFRVESLRKRVRPEDKPTPKVAYDWGRGEIRGLASAGLDQDLERTIAPVLEGLPPYYELIRAAVLKKLDGGTKRKDFAAFGHAYTDREGNVYSGISIYETWDSGMQMEMPDIDVLGILRDLVGSVGATAPIPGRQHDILYKRIGGIFAELRSYRPVREALADTLLMGKPLDPAFASYAVAMNALWIEYDLDPARLGAALPLKEPIDLLHTWNTRCKQDSKLWLGGKRRGIELKRDLLMLSSLLVDALGEVGVLEASSARIGSDD